MTEFDNRLTEYNEFLVAISNSPDMDMGDLKPLKKSACNTLQSMNHRRRKICRQKKFDREKNNEKDPQNRLIQHSYCVV